MIEHDVDTRDIERVLLGSTEARRYQVVFEGQRRLGPDWPLERGDYD
jgi:hypothetical protein